MDHRKKSVKGIGTEDEITSIANSGQWSKWRSQSEITTNWKWKEGWSTIFECHWEQQSSTSQVQMPVDEERYNLQHAKKAFLLLEHDRRIPAASRLSLTFFGEDVDRPSAEPRASWVLIESPRGEVKQRPIIFAESVCIKRANWSWTFVAFVSQCQICPSWTSESPETPAVENWSYAKNSRSARACLDQLLIAIRSFTLLCDHESITSKTDRDHEANSRLRDVYTCCQKPSKLMTMLVGLEWLQTWQ